MQKLILIKLGGSLITNKLKPFSENLVIIKRLAREIHQAGKEGSRLLVVGHGGGSYPHVPAAKYKTAEGMVGPESGRGVAEVQDAAARLNRIVVRELIEARENAISLSPSSFMIAENGEVKKAFLQPALKLLEFKMLPVVYGDVALDQKKGCCILSTEKILNFLAQKLSRSFKVEKVIYCGKTDGVYDGGGKTVPIIRQRQFKNIKFKGLRGSLGESDGVDVTGGMAHKVEEALSLAKVGIRTQIINGQKSGNLKKVILGEKVLGTVIK